MAIVYIHENKINHKIYVGYTTRSPETRWGKNGSGYTEIRRGHPKQKIFGNAILKYGWDNFEHHIVARDIPLESALEIEKDLIAFYRSNEREFGYNYSIGGDGSNRKYATEEEAREAANAQVRDHKTLETKCVDCNKIIILNSFKQFNGREIRCEDCKTKRNRELANKRYKAYQHKIKQQEAEQRIKHLREKIISELKCDSIIG